MTCAADNSINGFGGYGKPLALALLLSCLALVDVNAAPQPTGVRNSAGPRRLNEKQLQQAQDSLRHKSGFMELGFDAQGGLTLGNRQRIRDGSATARALLIAAVDSGNLYELESHELSPEVAFARLYESEYREIGETGQRLDIFQVQIDFADFDRLQGTREAKAALDLGLSLLHELVHGVLKLQDPQGEMDQIGECDAHVNQMRRELQLPERLYYHPDITVARTSDGRRIVNASLVFVERTAANARPSAKYRLYWLPSEVSPNAQNIAGLQQGTLAPRR
jgi:hypothetical protein